FTDARPAAAKRPTVIGAGRDRKRMKAGVKSLPTLRSVRGLIVNPFKRGMRYRSTLKPHKNRRLAATALNSNLSPAAPARDKKPAGFSFGFQIGRAHV